MCFKSIILSGGNTQTNGFTDRLANEIENKLGSSVQFNLIAANTNR
jgi:actin-related protein